MLAIVSYPGYYLAKCGWYSNDEALLAFWRLGEEPRLLLALCEMRTGHLRQFFDSPFTVDWEDDLLVSTDLLGYQGALSTVLFDRRSLSLAAKENSPGTTLKVRSDDLSWVADIASDRLRITGAGSSGTAEYRLEASTTLRWSADGARAVCISGDRMAVHLLDLEEATYRTLTVGKEFAMPPGFVELMYCWPLADGNLLLDIAGEEDAPLLILDAADPGRSYLLPGPGEMTTLATRGHTVLYCVRDRLGGPQQLRAFDCETKDLTVLLETQSEIFCAGFSPDGARVMIGLHSGSTGSSLVVRPR